MNKIKIFDVNEESSSIQFYEFFKILDSEFKKNNENYLNKISKKQKKIATIINNAIPAIREYQLKEAPEFNIFKILGLERREVITHTSFLANLLSPIETHQQSDLFLKLFIQKISNFIFEDLSNVDWLIIKEFEQIDLRLVDEFNKKAIFIENKIDTSSHSGQLSRYFKNWKENYKGGAFIYLTINGDLPNDNGFDELIYPKKEIMKEIIMISYKREIFDWLNSSLSQIKSEKVKHTINQYLNIIITL